MSEIKLKLAEIPTAVRFHDISEEDFNKHNIKPEELAYLASNFLAGQIYYERQPINHHKPFPIDDYRAILCSSESMRHAWPLLKKLMDNTPYRDKVELTVKSYS